MDNAPMSKHTPGPWVGEYNDGDFGEGRVRAGDLGIAIVEGPNWGAWRNADDDGASEFRANTALIAAAPDMYEALKEARLQIEYLHDKFAATGTGENVLARINAALAKAQTES